MKGPKNLKRSIYDKYNRRVKWLRHAIEQFEICAVDRLERGGKIRDREETEEIIKLARELLEKLPCKEDGELNQKTYEALDKLLGIS